MAGRGKLGRELDGAKREMFAALIARGVSSGQASRIVGINPRTGKRWRKGRKVVSLGWQGVGVCAGDRSTR